MVDSIVNFERDATVMLSKYKSEKTKSWDMRYHWLRDKEQL